MTRLQIGAIAVTWVVLQALVLADVLYRVSHAAV